MHCEAALLLHLSFSASQLRCRGFFMRPSDIYKDCIDTGNSNGLELSELGVDAPDWHHIIVLSEPSQHLKAM